MSRFSAPRPTRSTSRKIASASRNCCGISACRSHRAARRCRVEEAREVADRIGYPVVVRPSYVLGGRGMAIVFDQASLDRYMAGAVDVSHDRPVLIDKFLEDAFELDVDAVAGFEWCRGHRRHHGAHRGSRHPLGRQLVRRARRSWWPERHLAHDPRLHAPHRPRPQGGRADEHPVRDQGRHRRTCSR